MQRPTCTDIRIRSVADALVVFFAVSKGILPIVSRRLDSEERRCIRSGSVYVWEERGPDAEATGVSPSVLTPTFVAVEIGFFTVLSLASNAGQMVYAGVLLVSGIGDTSAIACQILTSTMPSRDEFLFYSERELDMELDVIGQP